MSNKSNQVYVKCPFYRNDDGKTVVSCEGFVDGSTVKLQYRRKADFKQQMEIFCCDHYKNCEIYRALMEAKYD